MARGKLSSRLVSDTAVKKATGKDWNYWFAVLEDMNLYGKRRTLVEDILDQVYGLSDGLAQQVTQRYEQERGLN